MLNSYWEYAGTRYKNKFRAIDAANGKIKRITFHAYEDVAFNNYTWSIEPATSLKQLQKERALQLRDTYDYIKLWFSGGADSTTMLNTFLDNNIHVDEIGVYRSATDGDFDNNLGEYEINTHTLPYLKSIQHLIPKTKIKIIKHGKEYFDSVLGDKWFYTKSSLSLRHTYFPKINGKNFCNLLGCLDPIVITNNGNWYSEIWDTSSIAELTNIRNVEMFYTTSSMPELHAKQCHMVKNYLINSNKLDNDTNFIKRVIRSVIRDKAIAPEPSFFKKSILPKDTLFFNFKDRYQYKNCSKEQKEKIKYLYKTATVNGYILPNLLTNYRAKKLCLSEEV